MYDYLVRYGGLLLALYNYNGLVAPGLSLYSGFIFTRFLLCSGCVPCSSSVHRAPGKKATVPICKVLVRPGRESNFRPTSIEADALTTRPRAGVWLPCPCHVVAPAILQSLIVPLCSPRSCCVVFAVSECNTAQSVPLVQFARPGKHLISYAVVFVSEFHCSLVQLHDWAVSLMN